MVAPRSGATTVLCAQTLSKTYGGRSVLSAVDFSIATCELVAVTGPSGSGKSTLLHCLAGIVRPDQGSVHWRRTDLFSLTEARRSRLRRTAFGILFQFGQLVPELSAVENVALPLLLEGNRRSDAWERASATLERFGIGELADASPSALSGGQSQRVALCRAVVTAPALVFADEPTGSLDSVSGRLVLDELVGLAATGTAVVLVTHDASVAARADRVVSLRDGLLEQQS